MARLCELACSNSHLDLCHVRHLPGNPVRDASDIFPMNWRFLPPLDPQVSGYIEALCHLSLCHKEPAKGRGLWMPWAGSLWQKRAGVAYLITVKLWTNENAVLKELDQWEPLHICRCLCSCAGTWTAGSPPGRWRPSLSGSSQGSRYTLCEITPPTTRPCWGRPGGRGRRRRTSDRSGSGPGGRSCRTRWVEPAGTARGRTRSSCRSGSGPGGSSWPWSTTVTRS